MQHGLFNTSIVFVLNGRGKALAFQLADAGYDVFLGNNRGTNHSRRHIEYGVNIPEFWNWGIDELAYDFVAMYDHILGHYPDVSESLSPTQLIYVGHSQGSTQAFQALSTHNRLVSRTKLLLCLSPACYVLSLDSFWLRGLQKLYHAFPRLYYIIFGHGAFAPIMASSRLFVPASVWSYLGDCMFFHLFEWSTSLWDAHHKPVYFQETPSLVSSRNLAQWLHNAHCQEFGWHNWLHNPSENNRRYGNGNEVEGPPLYDLTKVTCPVALIHGGRDTLVDFNRLCNELPNLVFTKTIPQFYHLDALCADDAHETLYPQLFHLISNVETYAQNPLLDFDSATQAATPIKPSTILKCSVQ